MGEIKSVKVDNWGVFFLQKLQNFFNKTDYCDLTLQFRDNSQLKVHRLVLSACTDYFNVLEQTCDVVDDALIMPNELQADVVVPIVNFMYTGTLEFELKMYGKLLRTAKEMNMTVLLKLLEAHRRTMENVNRAQRPPSPKAIRRRVPVTTQTSATSTQFSNQTQQGRRILTTGTVSGVGSNVNLVQRRIIQTKATGTNPAQPFQVQYRQQIGSTSVVRTTTLKANQQQLPMQTYIKNEPEEFETIRASQQSTSPFEQLRKGYNNNKRPAISTFSSPPSKKPNLEDVKEFAEQQRMRKQIAAEYGDDQEFEGMMDDDVHNDDDDDDGLVGGPVQSSVGGNTASGSHTSNQEVTRSATATVTFKQESDGQPPTIIVKDSSGSKMNHAKIISEVLRQYPHLAKGNRNIKLKIMPNSSGQSQRIVVKKESEQNETQLQPAAKLQIAKASVLPQTLSQQAIIKSGERPNPPSQQVTLTKTVAPPIQKTTTISTTVPASTASENSQQKRRIDSKTMHALIALGAENMAGPWLCLRCGVNGRPISIPSYRGFRRHLINTHKETIDSALCEHCGWRSQNNRELHFHVQIEHKIKTTLYTFPECLLCAELFLDTNALNQHMIDSHPSANKQQCIYCNKIFVKEFQLFTHMKLYHKHQAVEDGIIDASDEEFHGNSEEDEEDVQMMQGQHESESDVDLSSSDRKEGKVKILSDISLPMASSITKIENTSATSESANIDSQTKFVTADGNEMVLTDEQRKEIMSQLNQEHSNGGVVMVLNEEMFGSEGSAAASAQPVSEESAPTTSDVIAEDELDDSQIYAELAAVESAPSEQKDDKEKAQVQNKDSIDNLEWAENLITQHELADNECAPVKKSVDERAKSDDISEKLKELTGDWSEDENEGNDDDVLKTDKSDEEVTDNALLCKEENSTIQSEKNQQQTIEAEVTNNAQSSSRNSKSSLSVGKDDDNINAESGQNENVEEAEMKKEEHDELDLALQSLHEGEEEVEKCSTNKQIFPKEERVDVDVEASENKRIELNEEQNQESSADTNVSDDHSARLLEELIKTSNDEQTIQRSQHEEEAESIKVDPEDQVLNKSIELEDDEFASANLTDAEEFTSLEKCESTAVPESEIDLKSSTVNEPAECEDSQRIESESIPKAKNLETDWDDMEDEVETEEVAEAGTENIEENVEK